MLFKVSLDEQQFQYSQTYQLSSFIINFLGLLRKNLLLHLSLRNIHLKRVASPGSMHDTGCLGLVHWDDPEGWNGEGGGS